MKRLIPFVLMLLFAGPAQADSHDGHGRMGSHGMALIGNNNILLYHLALYDRPHDRQIAIPASFANRSERSDFMEWRLSHAGLVTIVPEQFDLNRLAPDSKNPITRFKADIYDGHFERGGILLFSGVTFELERPALFRPVSADAQAGERYSFLKRGNRGYLVRDIGPRPGVDMVLEIALGPDIAPGSLLEVTSGDARPGYPLRLRDATGAPVAVLVKSVVYRETADFR